MNNEYIMLVDENGQPYIAHAFWNRKGSAKKDHKYIAKIGEGVKARYFYTKQELDAYYDSLKGKANSAKENAKEKGKEFLRKNVDGYSQREKMIETKAAADKAERERQESAEKFNRAVNNQQAAEKKYKNDRTRETAEAYSQARNRTQRAGEEYYGTKGSGKGKLEAAFDTADKAINAKVDYNKTKLSKLEEFAKHPVKKTTDAIEDVVDDAAWEVEHRIRDTKDKITDKRRDKAMAKDPDVVKAKKAKEKAEHDYDRAKANLEDYTEATGIKEYDILNGYTDDKYAKKLHDQYWDAVEDLRYTYNDYSTATRKYGLPTVFGWEYYNR